MTRKRFKRLVETWKNICLIVCVPPSRSHIHCPASLEQFLTALWGAVFQAAVLILPQIKLNLQSSCCAFFKSTDEWSISLTYSFLHVKNHNLITYTSSPKRFCSMNRTPEAPDHQPLVMAHVLIHIIQHVTRIIQAKLYHLYYYIYIYMYYIYR